MAFNDNISGTSDSLSGSGFDGTFSSSQYPLDERSKLEQKIEKIREKITQNSIAHERDLEEYLKMANRQDAKQDNPQSIRIRQHFERKNKKYSQELILLQKKLADTEKHLDALDRGVSLHSANNSSHSMLQNVSHGIKKAGTNVKEMTGNVISAPLDIAYKMKKNVFGSADNLPKTVEDMGHSTFYVPQSISTQSDRGRSSTLPHNMSNISSDREKVPESALASHMPSIKVDHPPYESRSQNEKIKQMTKEVETLKLQNAQLEKSFADHRSETKTEILAYRNDLSDARFKIQQLEQTLNENTEWYKKEQFC